MADNWTSGDEARYLAGVAAADVPESVRDYMRSEESFPDDEHISQARAEAQRDAMDTENEAAQGHTQRDDPLDQAVWAAILKHEANLPRGGRRGFAEGGEADIPPEDAPPPIPAGPPPFDPSKPFAVGTRASLPPPFDPSKPFSVKDAPSYTLEKPFEMRPAKTQEEAEATYNGIPEGAHFRLPGGEIRLKPKQTPEAKEEAEAAASGVDYSGFGQALPKPPGYVGTFLQSVGKGAYEGAEALAHAPTAFAPVTPKQPDESETGKLLEKGFWEGITDPKWLIAQVGHGAGGMAPLAATAGAGAALGSVVPGVGTAAGGVAGLVVGAAASALRPAFERATAAGLEWGDAVQRSIVESGLAGAIASVMPAASRISMFGRVPITDAAGNLTRDAAGKIAEKMAHPVSEVLAQTLGVQPALMTGQQLAEAAIEGRKPTFDELAKGYVRGAGGGAAFVAGHHLARGAMGRGEQPAPGGRTEPGTAPPPPGGAPPPGGLPPVGEAFGMDVGRGVEPVRVAAHTPEGDVVLEDAEGQKHPMAAADVARLRQDIPPPEPGTAPAAAIEPPAPPAAAVEAPVPVPAADPAPPAPPAAAPTAAPVTRVTPPAAAPPARAPDLFGDDGSVMANLDRIGAEIEAGPEAERAKLEAVVKGVPPEAAVVPQQPIATPNNTVAPVVPPVEAQAPAAPPVVRPEVAPEPPPAAAPAPPVREEPPAPVAAAEAERVEAETQRPTITIEQAHEEALKYPNADNYAAVAGHKYGLSHAQSVELWNQAKTQQARPVEPVEAAPAPAEAPPPPVSVQGPDWVREAAGRFWEQGQRLGIVGDIERLSAEEKTALQIVNELGDKLAAVPQDDRLNLVRSVRNQLGIPSMDQATEYAQWLDQYRQRRPPENPPENEYRAPEIPVPAAEPKEVKVGTGDVFRTVSGRETAPAPRVEVTSDRTATNTIRRIDAWLLDEAKKEAEATGNDYVQTLLKGMDPRRLSQADRDTLNLVVFGSDTATERNLITRPAAGETPVPPTERPIPEAPPPNTDESKPTGNEPIVSDEKHTKTGNDIYAVRFPVKPMIDDLGLNARRLGGYWSPFRGNGMQPGWMFKTREAADKFADWARGKIGENQGPRETEAERPATAAVENPVEAGDNRPDIGPAAGDLIPEYRKAFEDYAAAGHVVSVRRIGGKLMLSLDGRDPVSPFSARSDVTRVTPSGMDPELHRLRSEVAAARNATEEPTEAQKESGNYKKGRVRLAPGLDFVMENPRGSERSGRDPQTGERWTTELPADYGYFSKTEGADGDHVDAYLGPDLTARTAYVVDQVHADTGHFDEHKVLYGFDSWTKAREAYEDAFSDGRGAERLGSVTPMDIDQLREWVRKGDTKNPVGQQALDLHGVVGEQARPGRPAPEPPAETHPQLRLADWVQRTLEGKIEPDARTLQSAAEHVYGGKMTEGKFTRADLYDAMELGVNRYIRAHPDEFSPNADLRAARMIARELAELKDRLPTQTVRAGEKDSFQQFSTPPDYAYAVSRAAKIGAGDHVLEPSAGTGSLTVHAMNAGPREVTVNELSANRAPLVESLAPAHAFRENAEQLHNILPGEIRPTVVVMNPPFSQTAGRMGDKMVLMTGARHIEQALQRLEPGGRLVAIVGRGMRPLGEEGGPVRFREGTGATFKDWWRRIGEQYDVRANIGVSGDVYKKYGTTFPTQLLVIDKAPPSRRPVEMGQVETIPDLLDKLEAIRNERPEIREPVAAQPDGGAAPAGSEGAGRPEPTAPGATPTAGVRTEPAAAGPRGDIPPRPGAGGEPTVRPGSEPRPGDALAAGEPERGRPVGTERHPDAGVGRGRELGGSGAEPDAMVLRPEGEPGSVLPTSPEAVETPEVVRVQEAALEPEQAAGITENVYEPYKPQRITIKGAQEHPTKLVQTAAMASVMPPDVAYTPKLPSALIKDGKLSAAQLEAITYAGYAHSQMLPAVETVPGREPVEFRRGYFIGDGTGVGKGAQVAGIILDNINQGRKKSLWVSESRTLINDARRDWQWLGRDAKDVFDVGKVAKPGADIKSGSGIGFLTYDTLKGYERQGKDSEGKTIRGKTRVDQIVDWLGKDFDGVIAFDESHNLANSMQVRGSRGVKGAADKALAGIELQQKLPNARVVYVSATGATEVMNLAYAERLGLWGPGTAFPSKGEFINRIQMGGVAAMELVARDMKALGLYISRNLSYDGVEYDRVEHALSADQKRIYDDLAGGWQSVLQNIEAALLKTGAATDSHGDPVADRAQRTAAMSAFWSGHQRFFNQIITSMQMPSVIKGIERDLKEGRQSVLQLVNTNEASQERAISKARAEEGDLEDLDMTPRDQLMQMIEKSFPTVQRETYVDENGNERTRDVLDSLGQPVHNQEALAMKDALLSKLGSIRVPDGPLEMLINHFGTDKVAEITGRKQRVVPQMDEKGQSHKVIESRPGSANITEAEAFQNAKKPVLVFSQAGMTGRSYHADLSSPSANARRSHYLVQAGWRADKAIQGFGRTHRTNQASAPIFHLVTTDLQGQRRFISSIARRLAQLGALTKGERRAGESGMFSARDNLESPEARAALGALWRDIQNAEIPSIEPLAFEQQTGLKLRDANGNSSEPPEITQFLNRLLSLKFDMQNHVFGEFESRLNTAVERAAAAGTLDVGTETLKADRITKEDDRIVHTDPQSGAETRYVRLNVENKSHPKAFDDIQAGRHYLGRDTRVPDFYVRSKRSGKIMAVNQSHDVTEASSGRIIPQYRLTDPLKNTFTDRNKIDGYQADQYWERIDDKAQAKRLWDAQVAALPEYETRNVHLITGAILPVWDRLQGWPTVYRLQTDAGEKLLGRTVHDTQIEATLKALGAEGTGRQYAPAEVADQILGGGRATLANGWSLRRSVVANEPRIELVGADYSHDAELRNAGVFTERIGYTTRYFVPTGEDAAAVLGRVLERRPVVELAQGREGLAERETAPTEAGTPARSLTEDLQTARATGEYKPGLADSHRAARDFVRLMGRDSGNEHFGSVDTRTGEIRDAGTSDHPTEINFNQDTLGQLWNPPDGQTVDIHHNHGGGMPASGADISMLAAPGLRWVVAHGIEGTVNGRAMFSAVALRPEARAWLDRMSPEQATKALQDLSDRAVAQIAPVFKQAIDSGRIDQASADLLARETINTALAGAGVIHYMSNLKLPDGALPFASRVARDLAKNLPWETDGKLSNNRVRQSAGAVRTEEGMGRLSRPLESGSETGQRPGAGPDQARRAGSELPVEPRGPPEIGRLAEEIGGPERTGDFTDQVQRETVREAGRYARNGGIAEKFWQIFGAGQRSPGAGDHFFNLVNKDFTLPYTKSALDPRFNKAYSAVLKQYRDAAELLHDYRGSLDTWQGKDPAVWKKLFSAMEVLTLEGREVPTDGRAIIVQNLDKPHAALSKVGDTIRITDPDEIRMFGDYRRTMDKVWTDLVGETARQFGWEGAPSSTAIYRAAEEATGREQVRLKRAAQIVAAVEYAHRNSYLPLMRRGDYFLRVRPTTPNAEWNGEGYAPTTMFKLIDSLSPLERAVGGIREGTPRLAQAAIEELRQQFPEGEYEIEHGPMFRSTDAIRDLDIPVIDKLMMLVGNDMRGTLRDRLESSGMDKEAARKSAQTDYDKLVDHVLDQIYEQRVAGFKRQRQGIPGYDSDFARSTGQYLNWLANHISSLRNREVMEAGEQAMAEHPDPRSQAYWRDFQRRREDYGDQLHGPIAKMRQAAFYYLLGANFATTAKILLHGPLRGVPVLTTGLGTQGRAQATADYVKASSQMLAAIRPGKSGLTLDYSKVPGLSEPERALLKSAERSGVAHEQTSDEMKAVQHGGEQALTERGRLWRRVLDIWGSNVSVGDRMVRGAMLVSAYRIANRAGMETINRVWDKNLNWKNAPQKTPEAFASFMVDQTVGIWGDINRMPILRSQLGAAMGQFKTYEVGYLSNLTNMMTRMGPEGKVSAALMLGGLGMMGGVAALPFAQDIEGAIEAVYKTVGGIAPNLEADLRDALDKLFPKGSGEMIVHGGRPLGIDWSGIGFGEVVSKNMRSPLDLFGAAASTFVGGPYRAYERENSGQGEAAAGRELLPNGARHMLDAIYPELSLTSASGGSKILKPEQLSDADRIKIGLGFQQETKAVAYQKRQETIHAQTAYRAALGAAENRIANLMDRGQPTTDAMAQFTKVLTDGINVGAFGPQEVDAARRQLHSKIAQRTHPELGSATQRRMEGIKQAQP